MSVDNGTHEFHVVSSKFLLKEQSITGSTFLRLENAKIIFEKQTVTIRNNRVYSFRIQQFNNCVIQERVLMHN